MPKRHLTAAAVERLRPPVKGQVEIFDSALPSFGLRLSYSGTRAWFVTTRINGKLVRLTLGRYPLVPLAEAREKAREVITVARAGGDPREIEAERERERQRQRRNTFGMVAAEFMTRYAERRLRPSTVREYRRYLQGPDTAGWRDRPVASITRDDVFDVLETMERRGSPGAANRALAYLGKFFGWCAEQDLISVPPTARVRALSPVSSRERVLSDAEIRWIWRALDGDDSVFGPLFKVLLLTGQRRSEAAGMCWAELRDMNGDAPTWEIPGQRAKNGLAHLVPLVPAVRELILSRAQVNGFVFSTTGRSPISGFGKAKARLDERITKSRAEEGLPPLAPWVLHDFRRTMVTTMNEQLSIAPHIVEAVVNHISGPAKRGVAGVYNRALYLDERRVALRVWADHVANIVAARGS